MNAEPTKKIPKPLVDGQSDSNSDLRDEYDFRGGKRGKYAHQLVRGIEKNMVPEHARKAWEAELNTYEQLTSEPKMYTETQEQ